MRCVCGGCSADTEAIQVESVAGHILLRLEHDDVDFRCKHAAQDHEATQAYRDTHSCGLNLQRREGEGTPVICCQTLMDKSYANEE